MKYIITPTFGCSHRFRKAALAFAAAVALQSACAETIYVEEGKSYTQDINAVDATMSLDNNGLIQNGTIILKGGSFKNTGTIETEVIDLQLGQLPTSTIDGLITAGKEFIFRGLTNGPTVRDVKVNAVIQTPKLSIISTDTARAGLGFDSSASLKGVDEIYIESNGARTGLYLLQGEENGVRYDNTVHLNSAAPKEEARIEVETTAANDADAYFYVNDVVSSSLIESGQGSKSKLQITNASGRNVVFELGRIDIEKGFLNLQTSGGNDQDRSSYEGIFILHHVCLGEDASLRASVYGSAKANKNGAFTADTPPIRIEGTITFDMASGSTVDLGGWGEADNNDWLPQFITLAADSVTINVEDSSSGNLFIVTKNNRETKASDIRIVAASANNTGNASADLEKLADVVKTNYKDEDKKNHLECLPGVQLEQAASDIFDGAVGEVGEGVIDPVTGDCINCGVANVRTVANPNVYGIAEMTALGLHVWRNEIDEMHRRMGELRDSSGHANGLWTRVYNGKASFGGQDITNKYTSFQFGYDHQVSPDLWLGGAFSYTYGGNDFAHGDGDSSLFAFTAYASRLYDNGIYLDFTGKVGRMKNSFDIRVSDLQSSGDYHTNAVSLSAEAGWRFYPMENVFVEPQLEVWYGHVFDAQYQTSTQVDVDQASTDSLVGRAGVRLGIKCPQERGAVFVKASILHDWKGEADFRFSKAGGAMRTLSEDLGGTWYEYGIGGDLNATDNLRFWAELERGEGGEVDTDYRATIGMRYVW